MRRYLFLMLLVLGALAASAIGAGPAPDPSPPDNPPRLVVLIVVDQLRADLLFRYRDEWQGGFRRILATGTVFPNGEQDHAITQTGPGHSTLLSGRFPAHTGIVTNDLGVPDRLVTILGDPDEAGASPRRFRGTTLADWMIGHDSSTQVLSVAMKDRAAILPVGRSREQVYWWSPRGFFTTSTWYRDTLPDWLTRWNDRAPVSRLIGSVWNLLKPVTSYHERDSLAAERGTDGRVAFPHRLSDDPAKAGAQLVHFPWMDSLALDLALTGVLANRLGRGHGGGTDLLSVSLSAVDEIGHDFGPDSREQHDMLLRLDGYLAWFLDSLAVLVPPEQTLFVLSADHGTQAMPEQVPAGAGLTPGRAWPKPPVNAMAAELRNRWRTDFGIRFDYGLVTADVEALRARRIDPDSLSGELSRRLLAEPGVARVFTPRTLAKAPATDVAARRWRHSIPPDFGWLVAAVTPEGTTWDSWTTGDNHGTPWQLDVQVPIVFWGAGLTSHTVNRTARTVDIAPTLARLIGVRPTEALDGVDLPEVVRAAR